MWAGQVLVWKVPFSLGRTVPPPIFLPANQGKSIFSITCAPARHPHFDDSPMENGTQLKHDCGSSPQQRAQADDIQLADLTGVQLGKAIGTQADGSESLPQAENQNGGASPRDGQLADKADNAADGLEGQSSAEEPSASVHAAADKPSASVQAAAGESLSADETSFALAAATASESSSTPEWLRPKGTCAFGQYQGPDLCFATTSMDRSTSFWNILRQTKLFGANFKEDWNSAWVRHVLL